MIDQGHLVNDTKEIARFLFECDKLDRAKLGEYISDLCVFILPPPPNLHLTILTYFYRGNEQILKDFCKCADFRYLDFDLALRYTSPP